MATKPRAKKKRTCTEPRTKCPYTGREIEVLFNERIGKYSIRGAYDPCRWYDSKQEALFHFSTRGGVKPDFPEFPPKVEVGGVRQPPAGDPTADLGRVSGLMEERVEQLAEAIAG